MKIEIENKNLSRIAIKGSAYNLLSSLIIKFGGLIFTVILARILLPELFGVYALVLSIVTLVVSFTDLGMESTFLRYLSESISKDNKKRSTCLTHYFFKRRLFLIFIVVILLAIFSKYLSYSIYKNPLLFYPLLFSCLFIIAESFRTFFAILFTVKKDMKSIVFFNASSQVLKILFSIFAILIFSDKMQISGIFLAFFISSFFTLLLEYFIIVKKDKYLLFGDKRDFDKSKINSYWKFMALATITLSIFGSIDILMLGKVVSSEYLAYYRASFSLIMSIASLLSLSAIFLPIFTQINGKRFRRGFNKTLRYMLMLSIPVTVGVIFLSRYLIKVFYGDEYLFGNSIIYFISIIIIIYPLINFYSTILQSKEKSKIVSNSIIISLIFNIVLNLLAIFLFKGNYIFTINAVALSTSISNLLLLIILIFQTKKEFNFKIKGIGLRAPIFATIVMAAFLLLFNHLVNMNLFLGVLEIILGTGIYLGVLILAKGITKEDLKLIKDLKKG